jgi:hypothetical protein
MSFISMRITNSTTRRRSVRGIASPGRIQARSREPTIPSCRAMMGEDDRCGRTSVLAELGPWQAIFGEYTGQKPAPDVKYTTVGPRHRTARPQTSSRPRTNDAIVSCDDGTRRSMQLDVSPSRAGAVASDVRRINGPKTRKNHEVTTIAFARRFSSVLDE